MRDISDEQIQSDGFEQDTFNLNEFENTLKGYGDLFNPPPPPPKSRVGIYAMLSALAVILAGVGWWVFVTSQNVTAVSDRVVALSDQIAERTEIVEVTADLSGVEANLQAVVAQNEDVLARLTRLEEQVEALSASVAAATPMVAGASVVSSSVETSPEATPQVEATPHAEATPEVTLEKNEFIIRAETTVHLVPDSSEPFVAHFTANTPITALGGFVDIEGKNWLVLKPTVEMNLRLAEEDSSSLVYEERPYVFVLYDNTVTGQLTMTQNMPLQMTLSNRRTLRSTPETIETNTIEDTIQPNTPWNVLGVYTHPITQIQWIVIDLIGTEYATEHALAFILYIFTPQGANTPTLAFGDIDMQIVDRMPAYPYTPPEALAPAPTDVPLSTAPPCVNLDDDGNCR